MECLKDKFGKTKTEKLRKLMKDMFTFTADEDETDEEYWDKFSKLLNDVKRENAKDHFNYMMCIMMLKKAKNKGKVSEEEVIRMKEVIEEVKEKGERVPKKDDEVREKLKIEFKKLKIENKRIPSNKNNEDSKETNVNFNDAERISRYQNWENL
jgi:hypothetical protein